MAYDEIRKEIEDMRTKISQNLLENKNLKRKLSAKNKAYIILMRSRKADEAAEDSQAASVSGGPDTPTG